MNIFTFTGNLGADVETKSLPNGTPVASFPVAVKSGYGDKAKTTWVRCALFGKRAEGGLIQYLTKGTQVAISGEMNLEQWESGGEKKSAVKVAVNSLDLIGGKPERQDNYSQQQAPQAPPIQQQGGGSFDDDIPFLYVDARAW